MLEAVVVEVEINDRPLTCLSSEVTDIEPLRPAHLMYGRRLTSLPHPHNENPEDTDFDLTAPTMRKQFNRHTKLLQSIQVRWRREYLTALREFHQTTGNNSAQRIKEEVVLIHDDGPRLHWRLGLVDSLITGNDGLVQAANVRTSNQITSRPITKLYPLEVSAPTELIRIPIETETDNPSGDDSACVSGVTEPEKLPKRATAKRAVFRLSEWTRQLLRPPEDVEN